MQHVGYSYLMNNTATLNANDAVLVLHNAAIKLATVHAIVDNTPVIFVPYKNNFLAITDVSVLAHVPAVLDITSGLALMDLIAPDAAIDADFEFDADNSADFDTI